MKTVILASSAGKALSAGYLAGMVIALLLLGYLIYVLIRPEKF